jgi:hypothetical protein
MTITITALMLRFLHGHRDRCIMDIFLLKRFTALQQAQINRVCLHLQVETLSDMTDESGYCIKKTFLEGEWPPDLHVQDNWPRQPVVTSSQKRLWRRYIASSFPSSWYELDRPSARRNYANRYQHHNLESNTPQQVHLPEGIHRLSS